MKSIIKAILLWLGWYVLVFIGFILATSVFATTNEQPDTFGSSDLLANLTLLAKVSAIAIPSALAARVSGRIVRFIAPVLALGVFVLAQVLPGGLFIFSIFVGDPMALGMTYIVIAFLCALAMSKSAANPSQI